MSRLKVNPHQHFDRLLRDLVLVKPYKRPAQYGSIHLPDRWQQDDTMTLWEVVMATPLAAQELGLEELPEGAILQTRRRWPVDTGLADEAGDPLLIIQAGFNEGDPLGGSILGVILY